ncbi:MAG: hypothetical protein FOGNACKC_05996 [Anaerolineae bacterium]|nr:hypothetical protein [Anaerolineae bacterium]
MSDIYFHTYITDLTAAEQAWLTSELAGCSDGQYPTAYGEVENGALHLYSDEESPAELDVVAEMLQDFIRRFRPDETIKFGYARICEPNEDESGGGAIIVTAADITWRNTDEWLEAA